MKHEIRAFVALTCLPGESAFQAVPIIAINDDEAKAVAQHLAGDVVAVLTQETVAALGVALAAALATIEHRAETQA